MKKRKSLPTRNPQLDAELLDHPKFVAIHTDKESDLPKVNISLFREEIRGYIAETLKFQEWYLNETIYIEDSFEEDHSARRQFYLNFVKEKSILASYQKSINALGRGLSATISSQMRVYESAYIGSNSENLKEKIQGVTCLVEKWTNPVSFSETMEYVRRIKQALYEVLGFLSE